MADKAKVGYIENNNLVLVDRYAEDIKDSKGVSAEEHMKNKDIHLTAKKDELISGALQTGNIGGGLEIKDGKLRLPDVITPGAYMKPVVDSKGRVVGNEKVEDKDLPDTPWSKVKDTPQTLDGYGIGDAVKKTGDIMTGPLNFESDAHSIQAGHYDPVTNTITTLQLNTSSVIGFRTSVPWSSIPPSQNALWMDVMHGDFTARGKISANGGIYSNFMSKSYRCWDTSTLPYETGSWTPELSGQISAGSPTYDQRITSYAKIGKIVICHAVITAHDLEGMSGNLIITGLPFQHYYTFPAALSNCQGWDVPGTPSAYSSGNTIMLGYIKSSNGSFANDVKLGTSFGFSLSLSYIVKD